MDLHNLLIGLLVASNITTLFFLLKKKRKPVESYEVKDLLQDLLAGSALIQIKRIAPVDVFLRSPRDL